MFPAMTWRMVDLEIGPLVSSKAQYAKTQAEPSHALCNCTTYTLALALAPPPDAFSVFSLKALE